jgi:uncharacterized alpha-E superfamily protein
MAAQKSENILKEILRQIKTAQRSAEKLDQKVKATIKRTRDYELERLLKNIDADMMDVQHKLSLARKLMESAKSRKSGKK